MTSSLVGLGDVYKRQGLSLLDKGVGLVGVKANLKQGPPPPAAPQTHLHCCLLYTSDAADDM
eukprot:4274853-Prorocentrum_lima.AAC.1